MQPGTGTAKRMRLGAHMSIEGSVANALRRGASVGCETIQIFTKNSNRWEGRRPSPADREEFADLRRRLRIHPILAHTSYLINLASADPLIRRRSVLALVDEIERCEELELSCLVVHPGAHGGAGMEEGIAWIGQGLREAAGATAGARCRILLETTAGQGTSIGHRFEQLRSILDQPGAAPDLGVCLDTNHIFAAGYDIRTPETCGQTLAEFDRVIGLGRLAALHLNDSKRELGSRVDRHEHIGKGFLGREAFRLLLVDPRLAGLPAVLETPKNRECDEDRINLRLLRRLRSSA